MKIHSQINYATNSKQHIKKNGKQQQTEEIRAYKPTGKESSGRNFDVNNDSLLRRNLICIKKIQPA
jgi:hypothetical protein